MREAVFCQPLRTPVGAFGGSLREVSVAELAATVVQAVVERSGLPPEVIDDVVLGQGYPSGEAPALGRVAALDAGLPVGVPGFQLDRRCGSGLQAVLVAAMEVQTGAAEVVLAGGADSMSQVEYYSTATRWGARAGHVELRDRLAQARVAAGGRRYVIPGGMIETAENLRRRYRIPRERQDRLALRSHQRAVAAQRAGWFDQEIVPVTVRGRRGETVVSQDEHPRPDTTLEALAALRPVMAREDPEATVTAGNASGQNDGAACVVVTHPARAAELGLRPLARLRSWAVAGVDPAEMGLGPVPATAKALAKAGLGLADCDRIELNEAFAAQVLAVTTEWGLDEEDERLNPLGSGIALGHPIGATGARILVTLLHELQRRDLTIGLETMCIGGGQGIAAVIERVG
ncbi:acetyl-CoA C-acetyltransferase [Aciditerrimonas ferrireducens]|uniref:acetyl-CoA C-acetyltransferase n=1 Tax=Aciditerrimonas ferrireducens TaxID=667306 RepID=UPI00200402C8|nr:acetyl-CoA C-acetyltransferase [Aciditerrimonas ferrireducens]MCK4176614.1 acetyl-CoA C-acetyltransferase [Aciditerrimonas ferrireducens]